MADSFWTRFFRIFSQPQFTAIWRNLPRWIPSLVLSGRFDSNLEINDLRWMANQRREDATRPREQPRKRARAANQLAPTSNSVCSAMAADHKSLFQRSGAGAPYELNVARFAGNATLHIQSLAAATGLGTATCCGPNRSKLWQGNVGQGNNSKKAMTDNGPNRFQLGFFSVFPWHFRLFDPPFSLWLRLCRASSRYKRMAWLRLPAPTSHMQFGHTRLNSSFAAMGQ
jgi:hypothetical protein